MEWLDRPPSFDLIVVRPAARAALGLLLSAQGRSYDDPPPPSDEVLIRNELEERAGRRRCGRGRDNDADTTAAHDPARRRHDDRPGSADKDDDGRPTHDRAMGATEPPSSRAAAAPAEQTTNTWERVVGAALHLWGKVLLEHVKDPYAAREAFANGAARGDTLAQRSLGILAVKGVGGGIDLPLARALFADAAVRGEDAVAANNVAAMLTHGLGGPADAARARLHLLSLASLAEEPQANADVAPPPALCYRNVALMFYSGRTAAPAGRARGAGEGDGPRARRGTGPTAGRQDRDIYLASGLIRKLSKDTHAPRFQASTYRCKLRSVTRTHYCCTYSAYLCRCLTVCVRAGDIFLQIAEVTCIRVTLARSIHRPLEAMRGGTAVIGEEGAEDDGAKKQAVDDVDVRSRRTNSLHAKWRRQSGSGGVRDGARAARARIWRLGRRQHGRGGVCATDRWLFRRWWCLRRCRHCNRLLGRRLLGLLHHDVASGVGRRRARERRARRAADELERRRARHQQRKERQKRRPHDSVKRFGYRKGGELITMCGGEAVGGGRKRGRVIIIKRASGRCEGSPTPIKNRPGLQMSSSKALDVPTTPSTEQRQSARRKPLQGLSPSNTNRRHAHPASAVRSSSQAPPAAAHFDCRVLTAMSHDEEQAAATYYSIKVVCRMRADQPCWRVTRRYSEFDALARSVQSSHPQDAKGLPSLPPKMPSLLLTASQRQRRVVGLQKWCHRVLSLAPLLADPHVAEFFDLSFGIWHLPDADAPPLVLDAALHRSASLVQAHTRRHCACCRFQRSRSAATRIQRHVRARAGHGDSGGSPSFSVMSEWFQSSSPSTMDSTSSGVPVVLVSVK